VLDILPYFDEEQNRTKCLYYSQNDYQACKASYSGLTCYSKQIY